MTTVVYKRDDCLASDGQISFNGVAHMKNCKKVKKLKNGWIVGWSGTVIDANLFLRDCEKCSKIEEFDGDDKKYNINAIVIINKTAYLFECTEDNFSYF